MSAFSTCLACVCEVMCLMPAGGELSPIKFDKLRSVPYIYV